MKNLNKQLDVLFSQWIEEAKNHGDNKFVCDGLMNGFNDWQNHEKRLVFITKDPYYDNKPDDFSGEDYRLFDVKAMVHQRFWKNILVCSKGILGTDNAPYAVVNLKKEAGEPQVTDSTLKKYVRRYYTYLQKEIREILSPNIIFCCGTSGIVQSKLYPDIPFTKVDAQGFVFYNKERNLLLLASYHPCARYYTDAFIQESVLLPYYEFIKRI